MTEPEKSTERYWEARWRDERGENERLRAENDGLRKMCLDAAGRLRDAPIISALSQQQGGGREIMASIMDALFARADMKCTVCGTAQSVGCKCWEKCSCGWSALAGEPCRNPVTTRCSTKVKYGKYNRRTKRYEKR